MLRACGGGVEWIGVQWRLLAFEARAVEVYCRCGSVRKTQPPARSLRLVPKVSRVVFEFDNVVSSLSACRAVYFVRFSFVYTFICLLYLYTFYCMRYVLGGFIFMFIPFQTTQTALVEISV